MSKYTVDCSWEMYGHIDIEAESVEEAIEIAESESTKLSDVTSDYVSGSFKVDYDTTLDQADNCLFGLRPGDEVHWNDPDEGTCSGHGIFVKYLNLLTHPDDIDGVAVIKKDDVEIEVFVKELS